jgi:hypothetical protein
LACRLSRCASGFLGISTVASAFHRLLFVFSTGWLTSYDDGSNPQRKLKSAGQNAKENLPNGHQSRYE